VTININGGNVSFENTAVGDHASMTVNQVKALEPDLSALVAAVEAHRAELPDHVLRDVEEAQQALAQPEPERDRFAAAMERIRDGAKSVGAVAGAAAAVLSTLAML
jgi:hypothetical protein